MSTESHQQYDDKLLDFLYEELPRAEQEAMRSHVESCARCRAEVESFGRVRSAAKSAVPLVEPPQAAVAKLLYQAAQQAPKVARVIPFRMRARKVVFHPAFAAAAMFLVVGGVASWQLARHSMQAATPPQLASEEAAAAPKPQPPAVAATPPVGDNALAEKVAEDKAIAQTVVTKGKAGDEGGNGVVGGFADVVKQKEGAAGDKTVALDGLLKNKPTDQPLAPTVLGVQRGAQGYAAPSPTKAPAKAKREAPGSFGFGLRDESTGSATIAGKDAPPPPPAAKPMKVADEKPASPAPAATTPRGGAAGGWSGSSNAAPPAYDRPLGNGENEELARSSLPKAPPLAHSGKAPSRSASAMDDLDGVNQDLARMNAESRRRDLARFSSAGRAQVAKPAAAAAQNASPPAQGAEVPPLEAEQLVQRFQSASSQSRCRDADLSFGQLQRLYPTKVTAKMRLEHAKCMRIEGRYSESRAELGRLIGDAPQLRPQVDKELKALEAEHQQRNVEAAKPSHAPRKKAATVDMEAPYEQQQASPPAQQQQQQAPSKAAF